MTLIYRRIYVQCFAICEFDLKSKVDHKTAHNRDRGNSCCFHHYFKLRRVYRLSSGCLSSCSKNDGKCNRDHRSKELKQNKNSQYESIQNTCVQYVFCENVLLGHVFVVYPIFLIYSLYC